MSKKFETFDWECEIVIPKPEIATNNLYVRFDPLNIPTGNILYFELNDVLHELSDQAPQDVLNHFSKPFGRPLGPNTQDVPSEAKKILTETHEGQLFLELVIAEKTDWMLPLHTSTPTRDSYTDIRYLSDMQFNEDLENESSDKWRVDDDHNQQAYIEDNKEPLSEFLGVPVNGCYVIRLVDEKLEHWLYVGKSVNIPNRLRKHQIKDGDFSKPDNVNLEFLKVEELRDDITERELYEEVCSEYELPESRVCGGH